MTKFEIATSLHCGADHAARIWAEAAEVELTEEQIQSLKLCIYGAMIGVSPHGVSFTREEGLALASLWTQRELPN